MPELGSDSVVCGGPGYLGRTEVDLNPKREAAVPMAAAHRYNPVREVQNSYSPTKRLRGIPHLSKSLSVVSVTTASTWETQMDAT